MKPSSSAATEKTRNTAYQEAQEDGTVQSNKEQMYRALEHLEEERPDKNGFTVKEIFQKAQQLYNIPPTNYSAYQPRLTSDLAKKEGLVVIVGTRKCNVSGKTVSIWETVDTIFDPFKNSDSNEKPRDEDEERVIWKGENR